MAVAFTLLAAACSAGSEGEVAALDEPIVINNLGGATLEGHTPQGFAGSGTGLFAGDNLNANFPNGEGVQLFVAFELPATVDDVAVATLSSEHLTVRGTPFESLGALRAQAVEFEAFGPPVFDTPGLGEATLCERRGEAAIDCDVTAALNQALADGRNELQLRVRFDVAGDGDGEQDMALFFLTDSNTNEPGIFTLQLG